MKFIVPDKIMPSVGERVLRQYSCRKPGLKTFLNNALIAITNRRLIVYEESFKKNNGLQSEIYIDNIAGVSFVKGRTSKKESAASFYWLLTLFVLISAVLLWQSNAVYGFLTSDSNPTPTPIMFTLVFSLFPLVVFLLLSLFVYLYNKRFTINLIIHSKSFLKANINDAETITSSFFIEANSKEVQRMVSEFSSIILDVQRFGPEEVLKHIEAEDAVIETKTRMS